MQITVSGLRWQKIWKSEGSKPRSLMGSVQILSITITVKREK